MFTKLSPLNAFVTAVALSVLLSGCLYKISEPVISKKDAQTFDWVIGEYMRVETSDRYDHTTTSRILITNGFSKAMNDDKSYQVVIKGISPGRRLRPMLTVYHMRMMHAYDDMYVAQLTSIDGKQTRAIIFIKKVHNGFAYMRPNENMRKVAQNLGLSLNIDDELSGDARKIRAFLKEHKGRAFIRDIEYTKINFRRS